MLERPVGQGIGPLNGDAAVVGGARAKDVEHGRRRVHEGAEGEVEFRVEKRRASVPALVNFDGQLVDAIYQDGDRDREDIEGRVGPGGGVVDDVGEGQVGEDNIGRRLRQIDAGKLLPVDPYDGGVVTDQRE